MTHMMTVSTPDGGTLNMRKQPNAKAEILYKLPNGTPVDVTDSTTDWSKIEYNGKEGWVMSKYLTEPSSDPQGQVIVPRDELERIYDIIGDWLGLRG